MAMPSSAPDSAEVSAVAAVTLEPAGGGGGVRRPCRFRDPEDGACYATADAADVAWLSRDPAMNDEDEGLDEDEDGGAAAPVDGLLPRGRRAPSTAVAELKNPEKVTFWKGLARTLKNLMVRKSDSRPVSLPEDDVASLFSADFPLPLDRFSKEKFRDSFNAPRGRHRRHHAIDLPAPRGTPIVAVVDGVVERLGRDRKGGKVVYLRDTTGRFTFYYAHLSKPAEGLRVGDTVKRGQVIGFVGSTGHVIGGPHLHFAIFREAETENTWRGLVVNPYLVFSAVGLVK